MKIDMTLKNAYYLFTLIELNIQKDEVDQHYWRDMVPPQKLIADALQVGIDEKRQLKNKIAEIIIKEREKNDNENKR